MENQRLILGIALAVILFLIWQAWMEEQQALYPAQPVTTTEMEPGASPPELPGAAAPASPTAELPGPGASPGPAASTVGAPATGQRIRVFTDQLEAEIDTLGGDLRVVRLRKYPQTLEDPDQAFVLLDDRPPVLYVAQSGLVAKDGAAAPSHLTLFQAEQSEYRLAEGQDELTVNLRWEQDGVTVIKSYVFRRDSFVVDVRQEVRNNSGQGWEGWQYRQLQRRPPMDDSGRFVYTYTGGVLSSPEEKYEKIPFEDMGSEPLQRDIRGGWAAMIQHYFASAWVPAEDELNRYYTKQIGADRYVIGLSSGAVPVADGDSAEFSTRLYVGPKIQDRMEKLSPTLRLTVDYGMLTVIAQPLFWLLKMIHKVVGNWGWSIILLTVLIKAVFFKLSETSYRSMANMRRLQPRMTSIREKYGHDKQKMNQAMMELYKKEKINPLGGCLPILVQIPVFIALYWMLLESVELRQAPFMLWIQDLSAADPYFVLPLLMGVSMFIQQRLNPAPPDPVQAKVMMALPVIFTVFFLWFPSGLVLYWLVNNILSIAQQWVITRRIEAGAKS